MSKAAIFGAIWVLVVGCGGGDVAIGAGGGGGASSSGSTDGGGATDTGKGGTSNGGSGGGTLDGSTSSMADSTGGASSMDGTAGSDGATGSDAGATDSGSTGGGSGATDSGATGGSGGTGSTGGVSSSTGGVSGSTGGVSGSTGGGTGSASASTGSASASTGGGSGGGTGGASASTGGGSTGSATVCGNDMVEGTEDCDGTDLSGEDCISQSFDAGTLACASDYTFDTSGCVTFMCGNDTIEGVEVCDGSDLSGEDCVSRGFDGGTLACASDCTGYDTTGCYDYAGDCCANTGTPGCDDASCTASVCTVDPTCCTLGWDATCAAEAIGDPTCQDVGGSCPLCGDSMVAGTEVCDGSDLSGEDCVSQGFSAGTLGCLADCSGYDTSSCVNYAGDCCAANLTSGCDDSTCTASVCATDPTCCSSSWDLTCATMALADPTCIDAGGSCPVCGDGAIDGAEVCDGAALGGVDCTDLGFDGGTLGCSADCLALDSSQCQFVGFGDCVNNLPATACLPQEQCITDFAVPPTVGVCTDPICMTVADCPLAPPGGTASVVCTDITGEGINECIIDCSLGQTCPTGMVCSLGLACSWPAN